MSGSNGSSPSQPEQATYDASVYQIQATDNVQGATSSAQGIVNQPLLNLANRTGWLKAQIASILQNLAGYALLNSPTFSGTPKVPTPPAADSTSAIANTSWVQALLGAFAPLSSPAFTGNPTVPTPAAADKSSAAANTSWVQAFLAAFAPLNSPDFTGTPTVPAPAAGDKSTAIANTEWVKNLTPGNVIGNGYQYLNNGLILQWGKGNTSTGNLDRFAYPIPFPNNVLSLVVTEGHAAGWGSGPNPSIYGGSADGTSLDSFLVSCAVIQHGGTTAFVENAGFNFIALGN